MKFITHFSPTLKRLKRTYAMKNRIFGQIFPYTDLFIVKYLYFGEKKDTIIHFSSFMLPYFSLPYFFPSAIFKLWFSPLFTKDEKNKLCSVCQMYLIEPRSSTFCLCYLMEVFFLFYLEIILLWIILLLAWQSLFSIRISYFFSQKSIFFKFIENVHRVVCAWKVNQWI